VGFVSATGGEGKTTAALGLAAALARQPDRRVLLIEADLRKPSIDRSLGLERVDGLAEWLETTPASVPLRRLMPQGFCLLSAGRSVTPHPELLGSSRMARLLQAARHAFDHVVVDCPPLAPVADSVVLQDLVDGFLFVVRVRHSPVETIQRALANVKPERVLGIVLNDHREMLRSYYSYGYRYYGEKK
jgi:capsular exopolysaccharide synthesis family protein